MLSGSTDAVANGVGRWNRFNEIAALLGALGYETRLRLVAILAEPPGQALCAGDLAARMGVPASSLSFHLKHLVACRVVVTSRSSRQRFYAVNESNPDLRKLLDMLPRCAPEHMAAGLVEAPPSNRLGSINTMVAT